jgi:CRISPR-associated protein Cmr6
VNLHFGLRLFIQNSTINNNNRKIIMNPSPWLGNLQPRPSENASFVEYLRWMRSPCDDSTVDSGTILELFQKFKNNDWSETLTRLSDRTKKLAHINFSVKCPWRIRVGGSKGAESMLLPAFDSLGMPYIPSSTLRGIARATAMQDPNTTEQEVKAIFGHIDSDKTKMGQVIFLDAYPLTGKNNQGGLTGDMTNAIWTWNGNNPPEYSNPNPNIFLSLEKPTFVIGLRRTQGCSEEILKRVRNWLLQGLIEGIGSRVNSGYGELRPTGQIVREVKEKKIIDRQLPILRMKFELEGQLIHGGQSFQGWERNNNNNGWKPPGRGISEVRSTAFRCMLRYWFRALGLGVLSCDRLKVLEMEIFGGLELDPRTNNPYTGLFRLEVTGEVQEESSRNSSGLLSGNLSVRNNSQSIRLSDEKRQALSMLLKTLTWIMFNLGGVGQGARRPCYQRNNNPYWRGATLIPDPEGEDRFWDVPDTLSSFQQLFQQRLRTFYRSLSDFARLEFNFSQLQTVNAQRNWAEAVDNNCQIFVCQGQARGNKCFALSILHDRNFYRNPEVCGSVNPSIPSPVWIRQLNYVEGIDYQIVTVFGASTGKRREFVRELNNRAENCLPIFPIHSQ